MKKKYIIAPLAVAAVFAITSCGKNQKRDEMINVTISANDGTFLNYGDKPNYTVNVKKGTRWSELKKDAEDRTPTSNDDYLIFNHDGTGGVWTDPSGVKLNDDYVFSSNTTVSAQYTKYNYLIACNLPDNIECDSRLKQIKSVGVEKDGQQYEIINKYAYTDGFGDYTFNLTAKDGYSLFDDSAISDHLTVIRQTDAFGNPETLEFNKDYYYVKQNDGSAILTIKKDVITNNLSVSLDSASVNNYQVEVSSNLASLNIDTSKEVTIETGIDQTLNISEQYFNIPTKDEINISIGNVIYKDFTWDINAKNRTIRFVIPSGQIIGDVYIFGSSPKKTNYSVKCDIQNVSCQVIDNNLTHQDGGFILFTAKGNNYFDKDVTDQIVIEDENGTKLILNESMISFAALEHMMVINFDSNQVSSNLTVKKLPIYGSVFSHFESKPDNVRVVENEPIKYGIGGEIQFIGPNGSIDVSSDNFHITALKHDGSNVPLTENTDYTYTKTTIGENDVLTVRITADGAKSNLVFYIKNDNVEPHRVHFNLFGIEAQTKESEEKTKSPTIDTDFKTGITKDDIKFTLEDGELLQFPTKKEIKIVNKNNQRELTSFEWKKDSSSEIYYLTIGKFIIFDDLEVTIEAKGKDDKQMSFEPIENTNNCKITGVNQYAKTINIPEKVTINNEEYMVTEVGEYAFTTNITSNQPEAANNNLISITGGKNLSKFDKGAFANCEALETIYTDGYDDISKCTQKDIPDSIFENCYSLKKCYLSLMWNVNFKTIGSKAFANCSNIKFGKSIAESAFIIYNNVESIGQDAFEGWVSTQYICFARGFRDDLGKKQFGLDLYSDGTGDYYDRSGRLGKNVKAHIHFPDTLENYAWYQIQAIAESGFASVYFAIGDTKTVTVKDSSGTYNNTVRVIGIEHDAIYNPVGGAKKTAGLTFEFTDVLTTQTKFNGSGFSFIGNITTDANNSYYTSQDTTSPIYKYLNTNTDSIYYSLDQDLQKAIKTVKKSTLKGKKSEDIVDSPNKLFPLSLQEFGIQGPSDYAQDYSKEGQTYAYYANGRSKSKSAIYWTRSNDITEKDACYAIEQDGEEVSYYSWSTLKVAPAFCI